MILYLDTSALVKRYIAEIDAPAVAALIAQAERVGTSLITRAEVAAALAKGVRIGTLHHDDAGKALAVFRSQWRDFQRLQVTEALVARADALAWEHGLRGYDAVHLAAAQRWQEALDEPVALATFDRQLWQAGQSVGLGVWPEDIKQFAR